MYQFYDDTNLSQKENKGQVMENIYKVKKLEELPMREYVMYAVGASYAKDFDEYTKQFKKIFLSQPERLNERTHESEMRKSEHDE